MKRNSFVVQPMRDWYCADEADRRIAELRLQLESARTNTILLMRVAYQTYVEDGVAIEDIDATLEDTP